jgi:TetR/AcrR family transcriptional regulator, transcriptional repressor for nem operon
MPRPKEFEPADALYQAMLLFWQKGYRETSLDDLVQVTGVSRYGFYSSFGDKRQLFIKAMELYADTVIDRLLAPMERADAALTEIHRYFEDLILHLEVPQGPVGCLIGNCALEDTQADAAVTAHVSAHFTRMRGAFLNALRHAVQRGELAASSDTEALADYLIGVVFGYLGCLKAKLPREATTHFITIALTNLGYIAHFILGMMPPYTGLLASGSWSAYTGYRSAQEDARNSRTSRGTL